jgi:hypothetical protein
MAAVKVIVMRYEYYTEMTKTVIATTDVTA